MLTDYILLALKNVRKRGIRSWLTMLGIFLGIAAVVALISLGAALQTAITGQFATLDPDKLIVQNTNVGFAPPGATAIAKLTEDDLRLVQSIPGVEFTIPRLIRVATVELNKEINFNTIYSMPEDTEELEVVYDSLNADIASGKRLETTDFGKVLIGSGLVDSFDKDIRPGTRLKIQDKDFEVLGILKPSGSFFIDEAIAIMESDMENLLDIEDEIDAIVVQVDDPERIEEIAQDIERKIRKDRNQKLGEEDFSVQTPLQSISTVNTTLNIINLVVTGIAAIALLIGGIGIANTMYTSVLERTREIGVMKAIGARNRDILTIFLTESALLGLVGGIIGAAIGLALAFIAASAASGALGGIEFKVALNIPLLLAAISFSLLIGVLSGIVPAFQASKLNPVDALRA